MVRWNGYITVALTVVALILVVAGLPAVAGAQSEGEDEPMAKPITLEFESNYWDLYPQLADVSLEGFDPLPEGVGVQLRLHSTMDGFSHFLYATNDAPLRESSGEEIVIRFEDNHKPEPERTRTTIKAVATDGSESQTYEMGINFYPRELYASGGQTSPGWVIVQETDLMLTSSRVSDFILQHPDEEELAYAHETWGHLIADERSDYENACALARSIMDDLEPHRGIPSDEMKKLSAFGQYRRVVAGDDRLWCGNIAAIFSYACNALGIPARQIGMHWDSDKQPPEGAGYILRLAEGHGSTEIFDADRNQWIWVDLTFYALGVYLGEEGPINMAELYRFLNDPVRSKRLQVVVYDPKTKADLREPVLESSKRWAFVNYFKRDQRFYYSKAVGR